MKNPVGLVFLVSILLLIFSLSGCIPATTPVALMSEVLVPTSVPPATETSIPIPTPWSLVVVGDSIPYNRPADCPSCTSFVDRYAEAITATTGHAVVAENLSQYNRLQIDGLLQELKTDDARLEALADADIIIVAIAHNDVAMLSPDDLCDGPIRYTPDWSKYNATCAAGSADLFRTKYESVFSQIVALRQGKPTMFRTINRYNDWLGWSGLPPEGAEATHLVLDAWNEMICKAAQESGFLCADIYHAFNGPDGLKPSGDLLASDHTHPSDKGNEMIASILIDLGFVPLAP